MDSFSIFSSGVNEKNFKKDWFDGFLSHELGSMTKPLKLN